jgi:hypothetical protein
MLPLSFFLFPLKNDLYDYCLTKPIIKRKSINFYGKSWGKVGEKAFIGGKLGKKIPNKKPLKRCAPRVSAVY